MWSLVNKEPDRMVFNLDLYNGREWREALDKTHGEKSTHPNNEVWRCEWSVDANGSVVVRVYQCLVEIQHHDLTTH